MHSCTNGTPLVAASVPLPVRTEPILLACALILCGAALGLGSDDGKKLLNLGRWSLGGKRKGVVCAWCTRILSQDNRGVPHGICSSCPHDVLRMTREQWRDEMEKTGRTLFFKLSYAWTP